MRIKSKMIDYLENLTEPHACVTFSLDDESLLVAGKRLFLPLYDEVAVDNPLNMEILYEEGSQSMEGIVSC